MGSWETFNKVVYRMLKLAYINLLWILFSIVGLGIFGIFPATAAMFAIVRRWIRQEDDFKIFSTFWNVYRTEFLKANGLGLIFLIVGYILYFDFTFLQLNSGSLQFLFPVFIFILISFVCMLVFFFPVYVHFELKFFQYIKQAFLIAITSPLEFLLIVGSAVGIYYAATLIPGIIPLFTGSVFAYISTWASFRAFDRIERRKV